jgi:hypothetical protein
MTDLRGNPATLDNLRKKGEKPIIREQGEVLAQEIGAMGFVECSALTKVFRSSS